MGSDADHATGVLLSSTFPMSVMSSLKSATNVVKRDIFSGICEDPVVLWESEKLKKDRRLTEVQRTHHVIVGGRLMILRKRKKCL